jgi:hypothetical protein
MTYLLDLIVVGLGEVLRVEMEASLRNEIRHRFEDLVSMSAKQ